MVQHLNWNNKSDKMKEKSKDMRYVLLMEELANNLFSRTGQYVSIVPTVPICKSVNRYY